MMEHIPHHAIPDYILLQVPTNWNFTGKTQNISIMHAYKYYCYY